MWIQKTVSIVNAEMDLKKLLEVLDVSISDKFFGRKKLEKPCNDMLSQMVNDYTEIIVSRCSNKFRKFWCCSVSVTFVKGKIVGVRHSLT